MSYVFLGGMGTIEEDARRLFEQGRTLFNQGNYGEARRLFEQSYSTSPNWRALLSQAQAAANLGVCGEASSLVNQAERVGAEASAVSQIRAAVNACRPGVTSTGAPLLQQMPSFEEPTEVPQAAVEAMPSFWQTLLGGAPTTPQVQVGMPTVVPTQAEPYIPSTTAPGKPGVEMETAAAPWMPAEPSIVEGGFATLEAKVREIGQFFSGTAQRIAGDTVSQEARNGAVTAPPRPPQQVDEGPWLSRYAPHLIGVGAGLVTVGIVTYLVFRGEKKEKE